MPYSNVPEEKWGDMDSCVEQVMADGKTKEQAIAICYSSIVERQVIEEEPEALPIEENEVQISEDDLLPTDEPDEPVGLAAELGTDAKHPEEAPIVEQEVMAEDIQDEPEQEIEEGIEGPPQDDVSGIVKVEFIDDGDDFEMDAFLAGSKGESPYPDMSGQEPPPYAPPPKGQPLPAGEDVEETPTEAGAWTPPNISVQELMDMEPAAMFYDSSVKDVVQSERELRAWRRKVNRMQKIAELRPRPELDQKETAVERVIGIFRRLTGRHYGPGPHPGTGTEQTIHAGGRGGGVAEDVGVAERPAHVGASVKLQQLANPRTTAVINDDDYSVWAQVRDDGNSWGTDKETGEMMEVASWSIADQMLDNVDNELGGTPREEFTEIGEPDENLVQNAVDEMIAHDVENDHYQIDEALKDLANEVRAEMLGSNPTWADISEFIGKSEDEMVAMSESDIDEAIETKVSSGIIDSLEILEKGEDVGGVESWMTDFILTANTSELREDLEGGDYYDVADYLQAEAWDALDEYHGQNPTGYNYDYLVDELGIEPETLGVGRDVETTYYEGEGEFNPDSRRTYFYSTDNETGEIVAVMQTSRAYEDISQSRIDAAAEQFGFDPDEVSSEMLVIDLLASKYPHQGYGTEMILNALQQAHEEDRGLSGSAVMGAAMFYDKLGAQYLSEMGQTEGGSAFWTNVQVHAAYEWLQEQMAGVESGEITAAEIGEEQAQAEIREPSARGVTPTAVEQIFPESSREAPANLLGGLQATRLGIGHDPAANSTFLSFVTPGTDRPVVAMEVSRGGNRVWEIVGSGQIFDTRASLFSAMQRDLWTSRDYGVVGSDTFEVLLGEISGSNYTANQFNISMLTRSQEANQANVERITESIGVEASLRQDSLRRVERHYGPGPHPGTGTPQDVHGKGGGGATSVGVTSAVPGKASGQVFEEMRSFADQLNEIPTIKNVSVTPGLGGWQGGRESTWVVTYEGNGNAMRLIARTAMEHEQEGVLFTREGGEEPVATFAFSDPIRPSERDALENILGETGVGGWQWFRLPGGQPSLRIVNVPQWGGDADAHRQSMKKLTQMFDALEMPHEFKEEVKKVDILEKEGPYGYDTILEG